MGRVTLVPYLPLSESIIRDITRLQIERIKSRIVQAHKTIFEYDDNIIEHIASRCNDSASGARNIENILTRTVLPEMSTSILESLASGSKISRIYAGIDDDGKFAYKID